MRETRTVQTSIFDFYSKHEFSGRLKNLSELLDGHPELLALIEKDLFTDGVQPTGRKSLSVESIFRCILLKQITGVSYEKLAFHLTDSHSYRAFARLDRDMHPGKSVLSATIRKIKSETLENIFRVLSKKLFDIGRVKIDLLRMDSTVVKSNIAPPLDSHLLNDGIRVLSRLFAKSQHYTGVKLRLVDYRKQSKSLSSRIFYAKKAEKDDLYEALIPLAWKVVVQSDQALKEVEERGQSDVLSQSWIKRVKHFQPLLRQVIDQTQRRVFKDEAVPASEKIVSLFEPHTDIIIKGDRDLEYGHKINLATDRSGLITAMMIEDGNPKDSQCFIPLLKKHKSIYGCTPNTTIADGAYASQANINQGNMMGIKRVAFHKKNRLTLKAMGLQERTLKKLKNFRAGIEGNISELKRAFGAGKALWKGEDGFKAYVWSSVISYNLTRWVRLNSS